MNNIFIYNLIHIFFIFIILIFWNNSKMNTFEQFKNNTLLQKCFSKKDINSFKKYYKYASILQTPYSIVYMTPNKYIDDLPQITWNGVFVNNLCIDPKMRNKGLGTKIILQIIKKAKKLGYDHIILQADKINIPANKIYIKVGFKIYSENISDDNKVYITYIYYL